MTRKDALREAIQIVSNARIGKQRKAEIVAGLTLCRQELPFAHWTKEAVFDACETWVQEHGKLQLKAFESPVMPSCSTIKNRFGMTAREFRDQYYPMTDNLNGSPYRQRKVEEWNRDFKADFHQMRCVGQADYNRRRNRKLPTWNTMAAMNGVKSWRELLQKLNIAPYERLATRPDVNVRVLWPEK